jgi:hypothetical protein
MNDSVVLITFTVLCNHHYFQNAFITLNRNSEQLSNNSPFFSSLVPDNL